MKIQLKRSNVLEAGAAKKPTAGQMEYGELAVNYNTSDTAIFLKDSADQIVRVGGFKAGDNINIDGDGNISADASFWEENAGKLYPKTLTNNVGIGNNNPQEKLDVTGNGKFSGKVTSASTTAGDSGTTLVTKDYLTSSLPSVGNGQININGGNGITATGNNATANQTGNTTRTLAVDTSWLQSNWGDSRYVNKAGDNMTGNLTFATNKITLSTNGNGTFAGTVNSPHFDLENLPSLP